MPTLAQTRRQRSNVMKSVRRVHTAVEASATGDQPMSNLELKLRLDLLEKHFNHSLSLQSDHTALDDVDENVAVELEDLYLQTKVLINEQLGENLMESTGVEHSTTIIAHQSKLPTLPLPSFDGKYCQFKNFITSFNQIIDPEHGYTNIDKFNQLLKCLRGPALECVQAFTVTHANYPHALQRLEDRYDNPTLIFMENVNSLFALKPMNKGSCAQLRSLVDTASALYGSLKSLGEGEKIADSMLIHLLIEKVDVRSKQKWNESLSFKTLPIWNECVTVLERHCQQLEAQSDAIELDRHRLANNSNKNRHHITQPNYSFSCTNALCAICSSSDHRITNCLQFKDFSHTKRFEHVKKLNLCLNCLSKGHRMQQCPSSNRCRTCGQSHHTLLHRERTTDHSALALAQSSSFPNSIESSVPNGITVSHTHSSAVGQGVLLATAMVRVRGADGHYRLGRALLDSCSQVNFVAEEFAQALRLPRKTQGTEILSIGDSHSHIKHCTSTTVRSRVSSCELPLECCITSYIPYQPDPAIDTSDWNIPKNIPLADERFFESRRIDLLLGAEKFFEVLSVGQIKLGPQKPTLQKTTLGWVVTGRYGLRQGTPALTCMLSWEATINSNMEHLWKLEEVPSDKIQFTPEQATCEESFLNQVRRDDNGRVLVQLPFKDDPRTLGDSYEIARRRFLSLERRLSHSTELKAKYVSFMTEYEELGHMTLDSAP